MSTVLRYLNFEVYAISWVHEEGHQDLKMGVDALAKGFLDSEYLPVDEFFWDYMGEDGDLWCYSLVPMEVNADYPDGSEVSDRWEAAAKAYFGSECETFIEVIDPKDHAELERFSFLDLD